MENDRGINFILQNEKGGVELTFHQKLKNAILTYTDMRNAVINVFSTKIQPFFQSKGFKKNFL